MHATNAKKTISNIHANSIAISIGITKNIGTPL